MGALVSKNQQHHAYALLPPPPPYEERKELNDDKQVSSSDDKIKYRIFYRYLNGLRRTFSGPPLYESYAECLEMCNYLNSASKWRENDISFDDMANLYHFPG